MPTQKILCDLDVGGEVKGTSLDINGNADIAGNLTLQSGGPNLTLKDTTDNDDQQIHFVNSSGGVDYRVHTADFTGGGGGDGLYIGSTGANEVALVANDTTALTLDTSQNATFAGDITLGANHIGRDGDNYIGFETDDLIKLRVAGATQVKFSDGVFAPQTDSDVDLGTNSVRFKDAYVDSVTVTGNVTLSGIVLDGNTITGVDDSGEFTDDDAHIMTSAGINDRFAQINANTTGSSGSCTGNAATATEATNITATANNSANETVYLTFVDGATGTQGIETDTGLSYNPSTGNLTTTILNVASGITHDGDINNKIAFTTDTQTFSCDGNESLIIRGNAVTNEPLFEINGAGAGNQLNIGLLLKGVTDGNPIKMKMQAPNDSSSVTGAGILSYEPDADTFNIGQSTTHNSMAISINNDDQATMTNVVTLSGGFVLDGNTITGVDDSGEFTNDDAHIMTSAGVEDKILGYGYTTNTGDATLAGTQTFSGAKTFSAAVTVSNSTASTSKTTGAVKVTGGVGIQGALNVGADVTAFASSDKRYKDNLQAITNPIDKVKSLTGYTFTWNDKHEQFNGNNDIGVVAQEVEKVLPEIVDTRDNGYKAVKYEKMVALLIEAVKDQQKQIDELKEIRCGCSR